MHKSSDMQSRTSYRVLVIDLFRAVDSSDWNVFANIFHPEIVYERPGYIPFVGIEQLLQFYQTERVILSSRHHIEHIVIEENYGACWGRVIGASKSGDHINELFADTYSFENGKIKKRRSHFFRAAV